MLQKKMHKGIEERPTDAVERVGKEHRGPLGQHIYKMGLKPLDFAISPEVKGTRAVKKKGGKSAVCSP